MITSGEMFDPFHGLLHYFLIKMIYFLKIFTYLFGCIGSQLGHVGYSLCFWHFVGQRALEHLLGREREGYANCTLVAAEAAKKGGGHLTAL